MRWSTAFPSGWRRPVSNVTNPSTAGNGWIGSVREGLPEPIAVRLRGHHRVGDGARFERALRRARRVVDAREVQQRIRARGVRSGGLAERTFGFGVLLHGDVDRAHLVPLVR